ncbi:MAG: sterol desaturase family protein [Myxococcales bacterium]|nr:sterol desaturase family protein [Myxococcales bacterium]
MSVNAYALLLGPTLIALIGVEALIAHALGRNVYRRRMGASNLAVAAGQRALNSLTGLAPLLGYPWLVAHLGLWDGWSTTVLWHWALAFLVMDFASYARHWLSHHTGLLWAIHAVHHQSEDYNLTVGIRLSWVQEGVLVALPAALLGIPFEMALALYVGIMVWQFFIHTELVGKLGVLDHLLMTPSAHRVHHGRNPAYLDKNLGGVLTLWDHLFGTFAVETEPVDYGTVTPVSSTDPITAVVEPFALLWRKSQRAPTLALAVAVWAMPPEWEPDGSLAPVSPSAQRPRPSRQAWLWVAMAAVASFVATHQASELDAAARAAASLGMLGLLAWCGTRLTGRRSHTGAAAALGASSWACAPVQVAEHCLQDPPALSVEVPDAGRVYLGPQGGYHVLFDVWSEATTAAVDVSATLTDAEGGQPLGGSDVRVHLLPTDDDACTLHRPDLLALLDIRSADDVRGRPARLDVTLTDSDGRTATDHVELHLEVSP